MASLPKGVLRVLTWFDSTADELKALVNDDGRLPVSIDEQNVNVDSQLNVYDGAAWVKSPIIWGYTDTYSEEEKELTADAGTNTLQTDAVPAGYVYVIQVTSTQNVNKAVTHTLQFSLGSVVVTLDSQAAVTAGSWVPTFPIGIALKEGDYVRVRFFGCDANDDLYLRVAGYKMKVDM